MTLVHRAVKSVKLVHGMGGNIIKKMRSNSINLSKDRIRSLNLIPFGNGVLLNVDKPVIQRKMYFRRNHSAVLFRINWRLKRREDEEKRPISGCLVWV